MGATAMKDTAARQIDRRRHFTGEANVLGAVIFNTVFQQQFMMVKELLLLEISDYYENL